MNNILGKSFADIIFENRNKAYGAYLLRRVYDKHVLKAIVFSLAVFSFALLGPLVRNKFFAPPKKEVITRDVEVLLEDIPSIAPAEQLPPPPPEIKIEAPKVSRVKFLPPKVTPDEQVTIEEVPPTSDELLDANPGEIDQEGTTTLSELAESEVEAQKVVEAKPEDNQIYTWVEQSAEFAGGVNELKKYLTNNLKYPEEAEKAQISDFVVVKFVINKDGSITDARIVKSAGYGMDEEAIRVIQKMPRWTPARQNGMSARQEKSIKIPFVLK